MQTTRYRAFLIPFLFCLGLTLGCSATNLLDRDEQIAPIPTRILAPTFTATPPFPDMLVIVTPPSGGTPGVIVVPPGMDPELVIPLIPGETPLISGPTPPALLASATPLLPTVTNTVDPNLPTETPTVTPTPTPTPTETPTLTPTPFVLVESGMVSLRTGPGIAYPLFAQLGPNIPIAIIGKNAEGSWYQICCISGDALWVAASHVLVQNDLSGVIEIGAEPPPAPTVTLTPTPTPTVTPTPTATPYPFERSLGPTFGFTTQEMVTIWVKVAVGTAQGLDKEEPLEGYSIEVLFEGFDRPPTNEEQLSIAQFSRVSNDPGAKNYTIKYNYKYEYRPPDPASMPDHDPNNPKRPAELIGTGTWTIWLRDGFGTQLSDPVTFTTHPNNPYRTVYVGWVRVR